MITIFLPYPPTVNNLYENRGKSRGKTASYNAWIKLAGYKLNQQHIEPVKGLVKIHIYVVKPDKRKRDVSNIEKSVTDLLVKHGILEDDDRIIKNTQEWVTGDIECAVVITPATELRKWGTGE